MSRAVFGVETKRKSAPARCWHASAKCWRPATSASRFSGGSGDASSVNTACRSGGSKQSTFVLAPTPRGSKLTKSKRDRTSAGNPVAVLRRSSIPEAPGPPGFVINEPMREPGFSAGWRINAMSISVALRFL